jgi:hypothetical protein
MSIPVALADLSSVVADHPWGYLVTVGDDERAHVLAVASDLRDGSFHTAAGRSTRANGALRSAVTMAFPHRDQGGYTLIVDGEIEIDDAEVRVRPTSAILHRPAIAPPG